MELLHFRSLNEWTWGLQKGIRNCPASGELHLVAVMDTWRTDEPCLLALLIYLIFEIGSYYVDLAGLGLSSAFGSLLNARIQGTCCHAGWTMLYLGALVYSWRLYSEEGPPPHTKYWGEPRALHTLSKHSIIDPHPEPLFYFKFLRQGLSLSCPGRP